MTKHMLGFLFGLISVLAGCGSVIATVSGDGGEAGGPGMGGSPTNVGGEGGAQETEATLHIVPADTQPETMIVVPDGGYEIFSSYIFTVDADGVAPVITSACISQDDPDGDIKDASAFLIASFTSKGSAMLADSIVNDTVACFDIENTFTYEPDSWQEVTLLVQMAQPVSSAASNGAWYGVPRSGHTPRFRLLSVTTEGGQIVDVAPHETPRMIFHKSKPSIVQQPLEGTLVDGDRDLIAFQVSADNAGPIGLKYLGFGINLDPEVQLDQFRLRRGTMELPPDSYTVTVHVSDDCDSMIIGVGLNTEDVLSGPGFVYTLFANVSGAVTGHSVTTALWNSPEVLYLGEVDEIPALMGSVTLLDEGDYGFLLSEQGVLTTKKHLTTFLWSDLSEVPHSDVLGGSVDWVNDAFIPGMNIQHTLNAP
jgi:hypothetical protein